jgi:hypothetical protein
MYLLTVSLHKDATSNSEHASIALNGPTTGDEMWMWSWPNLRYYREIRMEGPRKPMTYVGVRRLFKLGTFRQKVKSQFFSYGMLTLVAKGCKG